MKKAKIILAAVILLIAATLSSTLSSFVQGDQIPVDPKLTITSNEKKEAELTNSNVLQLQLTVPKPVVQPATETQATQSSEAATEESADQKPVQDVNNLGLEVKEKLVKTEGYFLHLPEGFQLVQSDDQQALEQKQDGLYYDAAKVTTDKINVMVQADLEKVPETTELKLTHVMDEHPVGESEAFLVKKAKAEEAKKDEATKEEAADDEDLELLQEAEPAMKAKALQAGDTSKYGTEEDWFPDTIPQMYEWMNTSAAMDVGTEAELAAAVSNPNIKLINLTNNIRARDNNNYVISGRDTVIINGNGFTIEALRNRAAMVGTQAFFSNINNLIFQNLIYQDASVSVPGHTTYWRPLVSGGNLNGKVALHNIESISCALVLEWKTNKNNLGDDANIILSGKNTLRGGKFVSITDGLTHTATSGGTVRIFPLFTSVELRQDATLDALPGFMDTGSAFSGIKSLKLLKNARISVDFSNTSSQSISGGGQTVIFLEANSSSGDKILLSEGSKIDIKLSNAVKSDYALFRYTNFNVTGDGTIHVIGDVTNLRNAIIDISAMNLSNGARFELDLENVNAPIFKQLNANISNGGSLIVNQISGWYSSLVSASPNTLTISDPGTVDFTTNITETNPNYFAGININADKSNVSQWKIGNTSNLADFGYMTLQNVKGTMGQKNFTGNAATILNTNNFGANARRILFKGVGDAAVTVNELSDNHGKSNSHVITGTALPNSYVRLIGGPLKASDNTIPIVLSEEYKNFNFSDDLSGNYTVKAGPDGSFSYDLQSQGDTSRFLTAGEQIQAISLSIEEMNFGKSDLVTVKDETAPVGTGKTIYAIQGQTTFPAYDTWVKDTSDSNPDNKKIVASWSGSNATSAAEIAATAGEYDVKIALTDDAGNSGDVDAKLIVKEKASWIEGKAVFTTMDAISNLSDADYQKLLLNASEAKAYRIDPITGTYADISSEVIVSPLPVKSPDTTSMTLKVAKDGSTLDVGLTIKEWGPTPPKNPDNPGEDAPAKENSGTGATGALRLDYVPSLFDFGSVPFEYQEKTYNAKQAKDMTDTNKDAKQWVQVSDNQDVNKQWRLTVKQLANFNNSALDMTGTELQIPKGTLRNSETGAAEVTSGLTSSSQLILYPGSADQVIMASDGTVKNTSVASWDPTKVTLKVPAGYKAKGNAYTAGLQWTLNAVPTNETP